MQVISPLKSFWDWFESLPVRHRQYLARMFWITTTSNTNEMVLTDEEYVIKFKNYLTAPDFPLRVVIKLLIIRSVFDFILENLDFLTDINSTMDNASIFFSNVEFLEKKQWEKIIKSWWELKNTSLSPNVFSMWARQQFYSK